MDRYTDAFNAQLWEVRRLQFHGRTEDAGRLLAQCAASQGGNLHCNDAIVRVIQLENAQQYEEALDLLDESQQVVLPILPGMCWYTRGVLLRALGRFAEAVAAYQQAEAYGDQLDQRACRYFTGLAYRGLKNYAEAITCFTNALTVPGYLSDGEMHFALGEVHERCFRKLFATDADLLKTRYGQSIDYGKVRQMTEKAIAAYQRALSDPGFTRPQLAWYNLGTLYKASRANLQAIECFSHLCPTQLLAALGQVKKDRKHPALFPPLLQLPDDVMCGQVADACFHLAGLYAGEGEWQKSIALYVVLTQYPRTSHIAIVWPELLDLCFRQGFGDQLQRHYAGYLESPPYRLSAAEWQFAGMVLARQEQYRDALTCYQHVLDDPHWGLSGLTRHAQGDAYIELEMYPQAITCYFSALRDRRYRGAHAIIWNSLGLAYLDLDREEQAARCFAHLADVGEEATVHAVDLSSPIL